MKFSFGKLKATFGNQSAKTNTPLGDTTEAILNDIDEEAFAVSDRNVMYKAFSELGGYFFMQSIIIGDFHIKTFKGAQLKFIEKDFELILNSDMEELVSDYSEVSGRSITRIDFQIEENDILKLQENKPAKIILKCDKKTLDFKVLDEEQPN
jgi:hypothetical protein